MARTTGPILAIGGITVANQSLLQGKHNRPVNWKVLIATGISAGMFALLEHAWEDGAVALAWLALVAVLLTRIPAGSRTPAPAESLAAWMKGKRT